MSVIGSIGNLPTGICVDYFPLETLESNPILEAFTVPVLWVPKAIQTTIPDFDYFAWSRKPQPVAPVTY